MPNAMGYMEYQKAEEDAITRRVGLWLDPQPDW